MSKHLRQKGFVAIIPLFMAVVLVGAAVTSLIYQQQKQISYLRAVTTNVHFTPTPTKRPGPGATNTPIPPQGNCFDSDGRNFYKAGYVTMDGGKTKSVDNCGLFGEVNEFICENNTIKSIPFTCTGGCTQAGIGGYCEKAPTSTPTPTKKPGPDITITAIPACKCGFWQNVGCGATNCLPGEMFQRRSCTPTGCSSEYRCVPNTSCPIINPSKTPTPIKSKSPTPIISKTPTPKPGVCIDTDGGKRYFIYGETYIQGIEPLGSSPRIFKDQCLKTSNKISDVVIEGYCTSAGSVSTVPYTCPGTCSNGACDSNIFPTKILPTKTPTPPPSSCSCSAWRNLGCGATNCLPGEMSQRRSCSPSGCSNEYRCVVNQSCPIINPSRTPTPPRPDRCILCAGGGSCPTAYYCTQQGYCRPSCLRNSPPCRMPEPICPTLTPPLVTWVPRPSGIICPLDAKQCPDGTYVGRVPPGCGFPDCPTSPVISIRPSISPSKHKPQIITNSLNSGTVNRSYRSQVRASDEDSGDNLRMTFNNLPRGLSKGGCNSVISNKKTWLTCYIVGKPANRGSYEVVVRVRDSSGNADRKVLRLRII